MVPGASIELVNSAIKKIGKLDEEKLAQEAFQDGRTDFDVEVPGHAMTKRAMQFQARLLAP